MLLVWNKETGRVFKAQTRSKKPPTIEECHRYDPETMDYADDIPDDIGLVDGFCYVSRDASGKISIEHDTPRVLETRKNHIAKMEQENDFTKLQKRVEKLEEEIRLLKTTKENARRTNSTGASG